MQATSEAETRGQGYVGTEHLLLALALDHRGIAGQVLDELGVRQEVLERLRTIIGVQEGGGVAAHGGDETRVAFNPSPRSNHPLLVLSYSA